jgi:hypothetical protein
VADKPLSHTKLSLLPSHAQLSTHLTSASVANTPQAGCHVESPMPIALRPFRRLEEVSFDSAISVPQIPLKIGTPSSL